MQIDRSYSGKKDIVRGGPIIRVVFELVSGNVTEFVSTFGSAEGASWEIWPVTTAPAIAVGALHY